MLTKRLNKGRKKAAFKYRIEEGILKNIEKLSSIKGGPAGARKAEGVSQELIAAESHFLREAVKVMIRRVAEVAYDSSSNLPWIRLSDLPRLSP